jgi:hypothetical protein
VQRFGDAVFASEGFYALALYGELEQRERDQVLAQFANRSCSVLVATDVASRGWTLQASWRPSSMSTSPLTPKCMCTALAAPAGRAKPAWH